MNQYVIQKFVNGNCSPEESKEFLAWLKKPESCEVLKVYFDQNWYKEEDQDNYDEFDSLKLLKEIDRLIDDQEKAYHIRSRKNYVVYLKYAASIVLLVLCISVWYYSGQTSTQEEATAINSNVIEKNTIAGQKLTFRLPDKSLVKLNAESRLRYELVDSTRLITLEGEGFFEVAQDSLHPFIVKSGNVSTIALGTEFNVSSRLNKPLKVSLLEGKVVVADEGSQSLQLSPGEQAVKYHHLDTIEKEKWDYYETFSWKDGVIFFKDAAFDEVVARLKQWYGVEFEISGVKSKKHYTGTFEQESLENVLESLSFIFRFQYTIKDENLVTLKAKES